MCAREARDYLAARVKFGYMFARRGARLARREGSDWETIEATNNADRRDGSAFKI